MRHLSLERLVQDTRILGVEEKFILWMHKDSIVSRAQYNRMTEETTEFLVSEGTKELNESQLDVHDK